MDEARKQQVPLGFVATATKMDVNTPFSFFYISTWKISTDERWPLQSVMWLCVHQVELTLNEWGHWHLIFDSEDSACDYLVI
jgi:hypothetical protein